MLLHVGQLAKAAFAVGAAIRFDAQVDAQMLGQVGCIGEGLGAVRTLVSLRLRVRLGMDLHVRL